MKNEPVDEAKAAGKSTVDFPQITADIFKPMDGGIDLSPAEIMGRNTWNLWSAGNQQFWNHAAQDSYGLMDLLKMLDNRKFRRGERFETLGLVNEPGFRAPSKADEFGLWLDEQVEPEPAGIDVNVYGKPSGVLGSAIGNQYINEGKVFACNVEKGGFFYEMLAAQPRGTSDTSRIATDHINNPNAINAIFLLGERERVAKIASPEKMAGGTLALPGETEEMPVPHVLKDGADSVGVRGATIRVYVNIGMFSEYWLTRHNRLIGLRPQQPFEIPYAREHSVFWRATEERLDNIAAFFRKLKPFHLADAEGGQAYITTDSTVMTRGKEVFAESCAVCHSSKQPPPNIDPRSGEGKGWFRAAVLDPDFLKDNFLSDDKRYPLTKIETNSARAFATNAKAHHIWDNFSSQTYKELSPVDELEFFNPFDETHPIKFKPKDKDVAPGYYRTPSLVSLWSSAPFLHNNMLGKFTGDPSVAGRMDAFSDAVEKLLWPEKRLNKDSIWRTQNECTFHLRKEFVPKPFDKLAGSDGYIKIGPIPKGTPINLLANLQPDFQHADLFLKAADKLIRINAGNLSPEAADAELRKLVPDLIAMNKCPDFVEDKGHYFGTDLSDNDKHALIEYLKTF